MSGKAKKSGTGGPSEEIGPSDEMKAKFRAALDKKNQTRAGKDVSEDGEKSKVHDAHGPAKAQQMFRRKSGG
ncbi:DUF5302 domain-containing protein [Lapillicoccus sp.]|uniref:DUF5302 domain-containing protein n=1 Tax=Lapillicoccus sp. TaxID=1909287 RepID=UPI0025CE2B47|nr:DUF5302 domain-containing protein [Lapillicoccus sp.]